MPKSRIPPPLDWVDSATTGTFEITDSTSNMEIYGAVTAPIDLSATVTLSTYFAIDPNQEGDKAFVSPEITVSNNTYAPLQLSSISITAATADSPKVVEKDAFEDWNALGVSDTKKNIALGLVSESVERSSEGLDFWFPAESNATEKSICILQPKVMEGDNQTGGIQKMSMQAKYGRAWDTAKSFKYQAVLKVALSDTAEEPAPVKNETPVKNEAPVNENKESANPVEDEIIDSGAGQDTGTEQDNNSENSNTESNEGNNEANDESSTPSV